MSYIKIGQIADLISGTPNIVGSIYLEDENQNITISNSPIFPLQVTVEVIDWGAQSSQQIHGSIVSFTPVTLTIPDTSASIRQSCYNQLIVTYPTLILDPGLTPFSGEDVG